MNYPNRQNNGRGSYCRNCQGQPYTMNQEGWHGMPWYEGMQPRDWQGRMGRPPYHPMHGMHPTPYHMAYPFPLNMQEEEDDERDMENLKSMFPESAQLIQPLVEDECDRMEYDGSLMFDEYPDKLMMERLIESIYQKVQSSGPEEQNNEREEDSVFATQCRNCNGNRFGDGLQDLISVMLFEEMHRRRCRHRRCKRWW